MAGKPLKKSSIPGVSIRQLVEEIPEGCSTPDFQQKPITLALQEGRNAIFRAVVCGEPRPEVHWQSSRGDLSNSSKYQISSAPGSKEHVLQINKLTGEDTDLYRCTAVNMYGEATCSARLTVIEVGFRKNRKRHKEPQEDLRKELMDFRKMLKKRAPPPAPEKKMDPEQVWQLLMTADRKDYEQICMKYGIVDYRGMLRKLQEMKKEREDKMAQYVTAISNLRHIRVTKEGVATFDLELELKNSESKIYLYKDGEMIPYGFDNQTKHCLRRLGKRYNFQILDLRPEDSGIYQVKVEDTVVFSTELEASAIPPRVMVPLAEARCEEQGDAVFECTLSNPCPSAIWHFQRRPLRPSDKYEVSVSPDGLTHRLVVKGTRFADMGLYSLGTGLHTSSAWLVVEGRDKDLQTTGADGLSQGQGVQASEADSRRIGCGGETSREQGPVGGSLEGADWTCGLQVPASLGRGIPGSHGNSLMGDEGAADCARVPGQERKGFLDPEGGRVVPAGESQSPRDGAWGANLSEWPPLQREGPEPGLSVTERPQQDPGREREGDRCWGPPGSRKAQGGGLGDSREGKEHQGDGGWLDRHGQEQLWEAQQGTGRGRRALWGSPSDPGGSWPEGEEMEEFLQGDSQAEIEGGDGLSRGRERGMAETVWGRGIGPGPAGASQGAGGPSTWEVPGEGGSSSKADTDYEFWGSQGGRDADHEGARGSWGPGQHPGQTSGGKGFQPSSVSGVGAFLQGGRGSEAKAGGSLREADDRAGGESTARGRGYTAGPGGLGGPGDWGDGLQELRGRGNQGMPGALGRAGDGSRNLQSSQGWTAGQRGAEGTGGIESDSASPWDGMGSSLSKTGAHHGPGVLGSSGGKGGAQGTGLMEPGQGVGARNHRMTGSPGPRTQRSRGTLGDTEGIRGPVAMGSELDFCDGSGGSRGKGPQSMTGYDGGLGDLGTMESRYGDGIGYSRGTDPGNGASYSDGSGVPGGMGSGHDPRYRVASGVLGRTESLEGDAHRHGSGMAGGTGSGHGAGYRVDSGVPGAESEEGGDHKRGSGVSGRMGSGHGAEYRVKSGVPGAESEEGGAHRHGLGVSGRMGSGHGAGHRVKSGVPGTKSEEGGAHRHGSGASGKMGSGHGAGYRVASGAPGIDSKEEGAHRHGSEVSGRMGSGHGAGYRVDSGVSGAESEEGGAHRHGPGVPAGVGSGHRAGYGVDSGVPGAESEEGGAHRHDSGVPAGMGSGHRARYGVDSGVPGAESEEGGAHRHGSGVHGGGWPGDKDHHSPAGGTSGRVAVLKNGTDSPDGVPGGEAWSWDAPQAQGEMGSVGGHRSGGGVGGPGGLEALGPVGTVGEGLLEADPEGSGRARPWSQSGDYGGPRASGAMEAFGEGGCGDSTRGPGPMGPGSPRTGDIGRFGTSGAGTDLLDSLTAGSGSPWASGSGTGLGYGDGSGIPGSQGSGGRMASGGGSRSLGPGRMRPGNEAGSRDGSGGLGGMGSADGAAGRDRLRGSGEVWSMDEAGQRRDTGAPEGMGSGCHAGYRNVSGDSGRSPFGSDIGYKSGLEDSGCILSWSEAGGRDGLGGTGGMGIAGEGGDRGGPGGPRKAGSEHEAGHGDGPGGLGVPGSLARMKPEVGPGGHRARGLGAGHWAGSEHGTNSKGGPEQSRGVGLVDGASPGVAGVVGIADSMALGDSLRNLGALGTQGGSQTPSDGPASENPPGGYGTSRLPESTRAAVSRGKSGLREGQEGSGVPGSPRGRGTLRGEGGSADPAGSMRTSGCLDSRGTVEGETWVGTDAPDSGQEWDFGTAGSGTADRARVAGQGQWAPQGSEGFPQGAGRTGAGSGRTAGADQVAEGSSTPGGNGKSTSGPAERQGLSNAWASGGQDQGSGQGSTGAGSQPPGSRASQSLQGKEATFSGTYRRPGGSRGRKAAPGQEAVGEWQSPSSLDSEGSSSRRDRPEDTELASVLGKEDSAELGNGLTPAPGKSGVRRPWSGQDGPLGRKSSGDRSGESSGLASQLGTGQKGARGFPGKQGSLGAERSKAQGPGALQECGRWGTEESGGPGGSPGPRSCSSQARAGASAEAVRRERAGEASRENRGSPGETPGEDWNPEPLCRPGSRSSKGHRPDISGQGRDLTRHPGSRYKPGAGSFSKEARGPVGHFSQGLADTEVQHGEAAMLSCTLTCDLGPGTWFKDGVKLTAEDGVIFEQDGLVHRLIIAHVQGTQAGRYSFVAGSEQSEATLTVQDPPTIAPEVTEKLSEPLVVKAGKSVTMKIPFQSRLPVQAAWRKDGAEVVGSSSRGAQVALGDSYTRLCLPSVSRKDRGQYSVTLRSEGGSVQAQLTLQVLDKPRPPQGPLEVQDCGRAGVCLCWQPPRDDGGQPVVHYVVERRQAGRSTWLKVAEPPADSTTFTDAHVEQGRKYTFRVRAVTSEGVGEPLESQEVLVAPEALPRPPSAPVIVKASSQGITLTWTAPRGPGSAHILGYLVEKRKKGSNTWTAVSDQPIPERKWTVVDVRQGCPYEFRVTAVAPSGPGEPGPPSDAVFARDPMRPPGPVRDLQVTDTSHTSITLSWVGPDTQDGDEAQGYVVELCGSDSLQWSPCHAGTVPVTTHTIKGLRPREGYFIRVTAVNDGGRSQPTALDTSVQAMPETVSPKFLLDSSMKDSLTVRAGDTIRVPVSFEAAPMPEVTWLKDGLPLPRRSVTTTKDGLTQLLIPAASLSDSGHYAVVLRSLQGTEAAYRFLVKVAACPQAPGPIRLQENTPGTVTAEWEPSPDEARGGLYYTVLTRSSACGSWREAADRVHTNRFTLLGVLPGHEYHFRVVAKNEAGASQPSDTSEPWCIPRLRDRFAVKAASYRQLDLSQKPRFLVGLRSHLLPTGCECCMSCAVQGSPRPHVTWFKNDQSLEGNPAVYSTDVLGVCSLVIPSVSPEDSGRYKAVAENVLGQAVSTAALIVIGDGGSPGSEDKEARESSSGPRALRGPSRGPGPASRVTGLGVRRPGLSA